MEYIIKNSIYFFLFALASRDLPTNELRFWVMAFLCGLLLNFKEIIEKRNKIKP